MKRLSFLLCMREKNNLKVKGRTLENNILVEESMRGMRKVGHTLNMSPFLCDVALAQYGVEQSHNLELYCCE